MNMRFLFAFAAIAFSSISFCADKVKDKTEKPSTNEDLMPLFQKVLHDLENEYVEDVSKEKLIEAAISGMLSSLDPHSSYFNPKAVQDFKESAKGQIVGIGMEVTQENGLIKVIAPIEDAPAAVAGIQAGDYIFKIDGESILGMTLDDAVKKLRGGAVGSLVNVHIYRPNKDPFELKVKRAIIKVKTVKSRMIENVGYIRITSFMSEKTTEMVKEALDSFKKTGKYTGLILDLRNNAGGQIEQAVGLCNLFLDEAEVVSTKGRDANKIEHFMSTEGQYVDPNIKLVVLINGGSASASEIVAGALQDHKRAIVMGTKSFGKASVQLFKPIGSRAVKYTIARYYTPLGRSIQAQGIEPDIKVEVMKFETVSDELRFREKDYKGSLKPDAGLQEVLKDEKKDKDSKEKEEKKSDEQDYQLLRAVELVKSLIITDAMSQKKLDKPTLDKTDKKDTESKSKKSASVDVPNYEKYASAFSNPDKKSTVSIVIANLGLKQDVALSAIDDTPSFVTLSFNPYSEKIDELCKRAKEKGHEILIDIPLEPVDYPKNDSGPKSILVRQTDEENLKRLKWLLDVYGESLGMTNLNGKQFSDVEKSLLFLSHFLEDHNIFYFDVASTEVSKSVFEKSKVPYVMATSQLLENINAETLDTLFNDIPKLIEKQKNVIVVLNASPIAFQKVAELEKTLTAKGILLAPLSYNISKKEK